MIHHCLTCNVRADLARNMHFDTETAKGDHFVWIHPYWYHLECADITKSDGNWVLQNWATPGKMIPTSIFYEGGE